MIRRSVLSLAIIVALCQTAHSDMAGLEWVGESNAVGGLSYTYTYGYLFSPTSDITLTYLGAFDYFTPDGLNFPHWLALWERAGADWTLVRQASIAPGHNGLLQDHFRYVDVQDLAMTQGTTYMVAASGYGGADQAGYFYGSAITPIFPDIDYLGWGRAVTTSWELALPNDFRNPEPTYYGFFGGNFLYSVPEPSTIGLLSMGLFSLVLFRRKRS